MMNKSLRTCGVMVFLFASTVRGGDWPMAGGSPGRNSVSKESGIAFEWDLSAGKNVKWSRRIGSTTYGNPIISDGRVYVSTNNGGKLRPAITGDKGVVLCLKEESGELLWQATHDKLPTGSKHDWAQQGVASTPWVDGDRLYYVSNQCQLVCADVEGFTDGENDGPFTSEKYAESKDADIVWSVDMFADLGVRPHNLANSSPTGNRRFLFVATSNGVDDLHKKVAAPDAPELIAVDKRTGKVAWSRNDVGKNAMHGQWSSPAMGKVGKIEQVVYGGGDGWCRSYHADTGKPIWKFDLNSIDARQPAKRGVVRNNIIATPMFFENTVFLAVGQDPDHGDGPGRLCAIDATKTGDVTDSALLWSVGGNDFHRSLSSVAIADGLLYAADLAGFIFCFDAGTGKQVWRHDSFAAIWGSPLVVDGHVLIGTTDAEMHVFRAGKKYEHRFAHDVGNSVYTTPSVSNGVLYIATSSHLHAISKK